MAIPRFILDKRFDLALLCQRTHARRLDLFGSALRADFDPARSDLDFVVAFDALPVADYSDAYFSLKEGLETLFDRPVDLLTEKSLANPYLRGRVDAEKVAVYVA